MTRRFTLKPNGALVANPQKKPAIPRDYLPEEVLEDLEIVLLSFSPIEIERSPSGTVSISYAPNGEQLQGLGSGGGIIEAIRSAADRCAEL